jgi:hypothetical protein
MEIIMLGHYFMCALEYVRDVDASIGSKIKQRGMPRPDWLAGVTERRLWTVWKSGRVV